MSIYIEKSIDLKFTTWADKYSSTFVFVSMIIAFIGFSFVIFIFIIERNEYRQSRDERRKVQEFIENNHKKLTLGQVEALNNTI